MNIRNILILTLLAFSLYACSKPVPPEKSDYVGAWREKNMNLLINQDGSVQYERKKGNETTTINAPIKKFDGDNIEVGIGPASTVFIVSKPPYQDGNAWKMVVDGVELTKTSK